MGQVLSLLLTLTFVLPFLGWAFDGVAYQQIENISSSIRFQGKTIALPSKLGAIEDSFQGGKKTIICVHDLHCHYEVQKNIAGIISYLNKKHNLKLIGEEGAFGPVKTTIINAFPLKKIRNQVTEYFMKQGRLTGAEYFVANSETPVYLEGIEKPELYEKSYQAVQSFLNAETQGYCFDLRDLLDELKLRVYNKALKQFDSKRVLYREGKLDLLNYCVYLKKNAQKTNLSLNAFSSLRRFVQLEQSFLSSEIDNDALMKDVERLDRVLRHDLYSNDEQKQLDVLEYRLDIMEKLLNISVTQEELDLFRNNRLEFTVQAFRNFIKKHGLAEEFDFEIFSLDKKLNEVEDFYDLADKRSQAFVTKLVEEMNAKKESIALMVNGGFHVEKVLHELRRQNISYLSVRPTLTRQDIVNPYFNLLQGQQSTLERLLASNQDILALRVWPEQESFVPVMEMSFDPIAMAEFPQLSRSNQDVLQNYLNQFDIVSLTAVETTVAGTTIPEGVQVFNASVAGKAETVPVLITRNKVNMRKHVSLSNDVKTIGGWQIAVFGDQKDLAKALEIKEQGPSLTTVLKNLVSDRVNQVVAAFKPRAVDVSASIFGEGRAVKFAAFWEEQVFRFIPFASPTLLNNISLQSLLSTNMGVFAIALSISTFVFAGAHIVRDWMIRAKETIGWSGLLPWNLIRFAEKQDVKNFSLHMIHATLFTAVYLGALLLSGWFDPQAGQQAFHGVAVIASTAAHWIWNRKAQTGTTAWMKIASVLRSSDAWQALSETIQNRKMTIQDMDALASGLEPLLSKEQFSELVEDTDHGFDHGRKVVETTLSLMQLTTAKMSIEEHNAVLIAAMLHDIYAVVDRTDHDLKGAEQVGQLLRAAKVDEAIVKTIQSIITSHDDRGGTLASAGIENQLVYDADTLIETVDLERIRRVSMDRFGRPYFDPALSVQKRVELLINYDRKTFEAKENDCLLFLLRNVTSGLDLDHYHTSEAKQFISESTLFQENRAKLLAYAKHFQPKQQKEIEKTIDEVVAAFNKKKKVAPDTVGYPGPDTVNNSKHAYEFEQGDFKGVDWNHFIHAIDILETKELTEGNKDAILDLLQVRRSDVKGDFYNWVYTRLVEGEGSYSKALVDLINKDTYSPKNLGIDVFGQNKRPRAQSIYEGVSNSLDALGLKIGQFGKGVKQAIDWLDNTGGDRIDVFSSQGDRILHLSIQQSPSGQNYIQLKTVSPNEVEQLSGQQLAKGTIVTINVKNAIPRTRQDAIDSVNEKNRVSQEEIIEGIHTRFPYITEVTIRTKTAGKSFKKVNGFEKKQVLVPGGFVQPLQADVQGRNVDVTFTDHTITIADNGVGMNGMTLSKMFVPKATSKTTTQLTENEAIEELAAVKVVQDKTMKRRMSFSRNGEVVIAIDMPNDILSQSTVEGGLMIEFGRLMDVPESRDKINIPSGLDPNEEPNFQRAVNHAVAALVHHQSLSGLQKIQAINTLAIGLDGLIGGNTHYEHAITNLLADIKEEMKFLISDYEKQGYVFLPHQDHYAKLEAAKSKHVIHLHEQLFDWYGAETLKALGGSIIPGITLGGAKRIPLVVVGFQSTWVTRILSYVQKWIGWKKDDRLPLIKTESFIAVSSEMGNRLNDLAQLRVSGLVEGEALNAVEKEFATLAERINIATSERVTTAYEIAGAEQNVGVSWQPQFSRSYGELDSKVVNKFLVGLPDQVTGKKARLKKIPQNANATVTLLKNGEVVEIGTGSVLETQVRQMDYLINGNVLLTYNNGVKKIVDFKNNGKEQLKAKANEHLHVSSDKRFAYVTGEDDSVVLSPVVQLEENKKAMLPSMSIQPRINSDATKMTYFRQKFNEGEFGWYLEVLDLTAPEKERFNPKHSILLNPQADLSLDFYADLSNRASVATISVEDENILVDLDSGDVIERGVNMQFRTDSTGTYTTMRESTGELMIYFNKGPGTLVSDANGLIAAVGTYFFGNEAPKFFVQNHEGEIYELNEKGEIDYSDSWDVLSDDAIVEQVRSNGKTDFSLPGYTGALAIQVVTDTLNRKDREDIYYDLENKVVVDREDLNQPRVIDPVTGQDFLMIGSGMTQPIRHSPASGHLIYSSEDAEMIIDGSGIAATYFPTTDWKKGKHMIVRFLEFYYLVTDGDLQAAQEISKDVTDAYSSVLFDGTYFVFSNPLTGDTKYVDPANPADIVDVPVQSMAANYPDEALANAKQQYMLLKNGQVMDIRTNAVEPKITNAKKLTILDHGYVLVERDDGWRVLLQPGSSHMIWEIDPKQKLTFSPDGRFALLENEDGTISIKLYDLKAHSVLDLNNLLSGSGSATGITHQKPVFSDDGKYLSFAIYSGSKPTIMINIDLQKKNGPDLHQLYMLTKLFASVEGDLLIHHNEYAPNIVTVFNTETLHSVLIDLDEDSAELFDSQDQNGAPVAYHTDPSGFYTAIISSEKVEMVYVHGALLKPLYEGRLGQPIKGVVTNYTLDGRVEHYLELEQGELGFDKNGETFPYTFKAPDFGQHISAEGIRLYKSNDPDGISMSDMDAVNRAKKNVLTKHPDFPLWLDKRNPGMPKAIDLRTGNTFQLMGDILYFDNLSGIDSVCTKDQDGQIWISSVNDQPFILGDIDRKPAKSEFLAANKKQATYLLIRENDKKLLILDNRYRNRIYLEYDADVQSAAFDGQFFSLQYPDKNKVIYIDPENPKEPLTVVGRSHSFINASKPASARFRYEIINQGEAQVLRDSNNDVMVGEQHGLSEVRRLEGESFYVVTATQGAALFKPGLANDVVPFQSAAFVQEHSAFVLMDYLGHQQAVLKDYRTGQKFPSSGKSQQIHMSVSAQYSIHITDTGQLVYYDHFESNPQPKTISQASEYSDYRIHDTGDFVILERSDGTYNVFSLKLGKVINNFPKEHISIDSSGTLVITKAPGSNKIKVRSGSTSTLSSEKIAISHDEDYSYIVIGDEIWVLKQRNGELSGKYDLRQFSEIQPAGMRFPEVWETYTAKSKDIERWDGQAGKIIPLSQRISEKVIYSDNPACVPKRDVYIVGNQLVEYFYVEHSSGIDISEHASVKVHSLDRNPGQPGEDKAYPMNPLRNFVESLEGQKVVYAQLDTTFEPHMVWIGGEAFEVHHALFAENKSYIIGTIGGESHMITAEGDVYNIQSWLANHLAVGTNGSDNVVLYDSEKKDYAYLDAKALKKHLATSEIKLVSAEEQAKMTQALKRWQQIVVPQRDHLIAKARQSFKPLMDVLNLLPQAYHGSIKQQLLPDITALYQLQEQDIHRRFSGIIEGQELNAADPVLVVNQIDKRMQALTNGLTGFLQRIINQVEKERGPTFKKEFYENLFGNLMQLAANRAVSLSGFSEEAFLAMGLGYRIESENDLKSIERINGFVTQLVPSEKSSLVLPSKIITFLSKAMKQDNKKRKIVEDQVARFSSFEKNNATVFNQYLQNLTLSFGSVAEQDLSAYAKDESRYQDLGQAKDFAYFLTHAVEPIREQQPFVPEGRNLFHAIQSQGIQLSQILALEKMRSKPEEDDVVMDVDYLVREINEDIAGHRKLPAPNQTMEEDYLRNTKVQRESGAYAAEIPQNSLDATQGKKGELIVDFYKQRNGNQLEFVEEASDNGTGALKEVALLIDRSTKTKGGQVDTIGNFGTGKYTIFEGVDRVEIISKNKDRAYMFTFVVEKSSDGKAKAIRLTGIRAVEDERVPVGVSIKRIKKIENTIPELDQTLAKRAWKTFAGLTQHVSGNSDFTIYMKDYKGIKHPLHVEAEVLSELSFKAAKPDTDGSFPKVRIIQTDDMPLQIVDKAGLRVSEIKESYLELIPKAFRDKKQIDHFKQLGLNIQIPLPLIRDRSGFEHEDRYLQEIQKAVAIAFYQALAYKTLTSDKQDFVFEGFPMDWETNDHYWNAIKQRQDSDIMALATKINANATEDITFQEVQALLPGEEQLDRAQKFVKLILYLEVAMDRQIPNERYSLYGRRIAIQEEINRKRAEEERRRAGVSRRSIPGKDKIRHFSARVNQASDIDKAHDQMRHPERYQIEPQTQSEFELMDLALSIGKKLGIKKIVLMKKEVLFAGAFKGNTMYLNQVMATRLGKPGVNGVDEATNTIVHELAHLVERLIESDRVYLERNEIYVPEVATFTHESVGLFAEAMKYVASIALANHKARQHEEVDEKLEELKEEQQSYEASILGPGGAAKVAPFWEEQTFRFIPFAIPTLVNDISLQTLVTLDPSAFGIALGFSTIVFAGAHIVRDWIVRAKKVIGWSGLLPWNVIRFAEKGDLKLFGRHMIHATLFTTVYLGALLLAGWLDPSAGQQAFHGVAIIASTAVHWFWNKKAQASKTKWMEIASLGQIESSATLVEEEVENLYQSVFGLNRHIDPGARAAFARGLKSGSLTSGHLKLKFTFDNKARIQSKRGVYTKEEAQRFSKLGNIFTPLSIDRNIGNHIDDIIGNIAETIKLVDPARSMEVVELGASSTPLAALELANHLKERAAGIQVVGIDQVKAHCIITDPVTHTKVLFDQQGTILSFSGFAREAIQQMMEGDFGIIDRAYQLRKQLITEAGTTHFFKGFYQNDVGTLHPWSDPRFAKAGLELVQNDALSFNLKEPADIIRSINFGYLFTGEKRRKLLDRISKNLNTGGMYAEAWAIFEHITLYRLYQKRQGRLVQLTKQEAQRWNAIPRDGPDQTLDNQTINYLENMTPNVLRIIRELSDKFGQAFEGVYILPQQGQENFLSFVPSQNIILGVPSHQLPDRMTLLEWKELYNIELQPFEPKDSFTLEQKGAIYMDATVISGQAVSLVFLMLKGLRQILVDQQLEPVVFLEDKSSDQVKRQILGGILPWMKGFFVNTLKMNRATYNQWAFAIENTFLLGVGGIVLYAATGLTNSDLFVVGQGIYAAIWVAFPFLHLIKSKSEQATSGTVALAGLISLVNLAMLFTGWSLPIVVALSYVSHGIVNALARTGKTGMWQRVTDSFKQFSTWMLINVFKGFIKQGPENIPRFAGIFIVSVLLVLSCEKEPLEPDNQMQSGTITKTFPEEFFDAELMEHMGFEVEQQNDGTYFFYHPEHPTVNYGLQSYIAEQDGVLVVKQMDTTMLQIKDSKQDLGDWIDSTDGQAEQTGKKDATLLTTEKTDTTTQAVQDTVIEAGLTIKDLLGDVAINEALYKKHAISEAVYQFKDELFGSQFDLLNTIHIRLGTQFKVGYQELETSQKDLDLELTNKDVVFVITIPRGYQRLLETKPETGAVEKMLYAAQSRLVGAVVAAKLRAYVKETRQLLEEHAIEEKMLQDEYLGNELKQVPVYQIPGMGGMLLGSQFYQGKGNRKLGVTGSEIGKLVEALRQSSGTGQTLWDALKPSLQTVLRSGQVPSSATLVAALQEMDVKQIGDALLKNHVHYLQQTLVHAASNPSLLAMEVNHTVDLIIRSKNGMPLMEAPFQKDEVQRNGDQVTLILDEQSRVALRLVVNQMLSTSTNSTTTSVLAFLKDIMEKEALSVDQSSRLQQLLGRLTLPEGQVASTVIGEDVDKFAGSAVTGKVDVQRLQVNGNVLEMNRPVVISIMAEKAERLALLDQGSSQEQVTVVPYKGRLPIALEERGTFGKDMAAHLKNASLFKEMLQAHQPLAQSYYRWYGKKTAVNNRRMARVMIRILKQQARQLDSNPGMKAVYSEALEATSDMFRASKRFKAVVLGTISGKPVFIPITLRRGGQLAFSWLWQKQTPDFKLNDKLKEQIRRERLRNFRMSAAA